MESHPPRARSSGSLWRKEPGPHIGIFNAAFIGFFSVTQHVAGPAARPTGARRPLGQVLTVKFGTFPEDADKKVQEASSGQIQEWTTRA
jgi:hypothetical protein